MKIIQTFWSRPTFYSDSSIYQNRQYGGWLDYRYMIMSMMYSCLTLKRFYPDLKLYTDSQGVNILIDKLKLPYESVLNCLDDIDVNVSIWVYAKLLAYKMQTSPFIHIDNDIFIWEKMPKRIENAALICQNKELIIPKEMSDYSLALNYMKQHFTYLPDFIKKFHGTTTYNMGIFGGNDIEFLHRYAVDAINNIHHMKQDIDISDKYQGRFNVILEQLAFSERCHQFGRSVEVLISGKNPFEHLFSIEAAPLLSRFIHCLGGTKKMGFICEQIEAKLRYDYPEYYQIAKNYLNSVGNFEFLDDTQFEMYNQLYEQLMAFDNLKSFVEGLSFIMKSGFSVKNVGEDCFLMCNGKVDSPLKGWGKMYYYFDHEMSAQDLINKFKELSINEMDDDYICESIVHLILQGLFVKKCLKIVV